MLSSAMRREVPAASAVAFRVLFGALAVVGAVRILLKGWVDTLYLAPEYHFTYLGFGWVEPWPTPLMYLHIVAMAVLGLAIMLGAFYRVSVALYVIAFTYVELIDRALYLNHYYWVTLAGLLMLVLPLNRHLSVDAARGAVSRSDTVPTWALWSLRFQVGVVYVFAGLAKWNTDWILNAEPLAIWLPTRGDLPLIGPALEVRSTAYALSWAAVLFDTTIVVWLLIRRTRLAAYAALVLFHLGTAIVFPQIGMFPWIMIGAATIFLAPDWPRALARGGEGAHRRAARIGPAPTPVLAIALVLFAAVQVAVPFRHVLYPGDVRWTEEGYRFSWRVMLTEKAGTFDYIVTDRASGERWQVDPAMYLAPHQERVAALQPDMIQDTARLIADDLAADGRSVEVRARTAVSINGRRAQPLVDSSIDLASQPRGLRPRSWILARAGETPGRRSAGALGPGVRLHEPTTVN